MRGERTIPLLSDGLREDREPSLSSLMACERRENHLFPLTWPKNEAISLLSYTAWEQGHSYWATTSPHNPLYVYCTGGTECCSHVPGSQGTWIQFSVTAIFFSLPCAAFSLLSSLRFTCIVCVCVCVCVCVFAAIPCHSGSQE